MPSNLAKHGLIAEDDGTRPILRPGNPGEEQADDDSVEENADHRLEADEDQAPEAAVPVIVRDTVANGKDGFHTEEHSVLESFQPELAPATRCWGQDWHWSRGCGAGTGTNEWPSSVPAPALAPSLFVIRASHRRFSSLLS